MEVLGYFILGAALLGAGAARFTHVHPLVIAVSIGVLAAPPIMLIAAGFMSSASIAAGAVAGIIAMIAAALGSFMGWLRRTHLEKKR